jgi:hypothetical protein
LKYPVHIEPNDDNSYHTKTDPSLSTALAAMSVDEPLWSASLPGPTNSQLKRLLSTLWSLKLCQSCTISGRCTLSGCPSSKLQTHDRFLKYYRVLASTYEPVASNTPATLQSHDDIIRIIETIKENPYENKDTIARKAFSAPSHLEDEDCALNIALSAMTMIQCSSPNMSLILLEEGYNRIRWRRDVSASSYITMVLPTKVNLSDRYSRSPLFQDISAPVITATELKRVVGMSFLGTNDITNHLRYDPVHNTLSIFYYTSVLKEQLRLTKDLDRDVDPGEYLRWYVIPNSFRSCVASTGEIEAYMSH